MVLPKSLAHSLGNIPRLVICSKVSNSLQFMDPNTLQTADVQAGVYWRNPFPSLCDVTELYEFIVLDVEPTGVIKGNKGLADITVSRAADLGVNDNSYYVRSHLGGILHPGDSCMGYFLTNSNFNSDLWESLDTDNTPEVVLIKKHYARKNNKKKFRNWKWKRMDKEHNDIVAHDDLRQARQEQERAERDYEIFLQELEEDQELRQTINLYKAGEQAAPAAAEDDMESEDEGPEIAIDELLDELDDMTLQDQEMN